MGEAASPATLLVQVCWIASPDPVRYFILSPFAFILGIGAANPVLPFVLWVSLRVLVKMQDGKFKNQDLAFGEIQSLNLMLKGES